MAKNKTNLFVVKTSRLKNWEQFNRYITQITDSSKNEINLILFPEDTFKYKYTSKKINEELENVFLPNNTYIFFSAFQVYDHWIDRKIKDSNIQRHLRKTSRHPYAHCYDCFGYLISNNGSLKIQNYKKIYETPFDEWNMNSNIKVRHKPPFELFPEFRWRRLYDNQPEKRFKFPSVRVGKNTIDLKVCADYKITSRKKPTLTLCPASGLNINEDKDEFIDDFTIINDSDEKSIKAIFNKKIYQGNDTIELCKENNVIAYIV